MIRRLRKRHLAMHATLAVLLPLGVGFALRARGEVPQQELPSAFATDEVEFGELVTEREEDLDGRPLRLALGKDSNGRRTLLLQAVDGVRHPSLLVYWERDGEAAEAAGEERLLLGTLHGSSRQVFALPASASGRLVLHSLAYGEDVAQLSVEGVN